MAVDRMVSNTDPIPASGGMLTFTGGGLASCAACGWRGVPTISDGVVSTYCPACEHEPDVIPVRKVPRNAPCPCGSNVKFKKCCGA